MNDDSKNTNGADNPVLPTVVDRTTWQAELDALRVREKAHTREGDAIAAARRRLPMVEVDADLALIGPHGQLTLLEAFEGRRQLIAYYFMWHTGRPAPEQCEGCTWCTTQVAELSYLHSRDITYAVFCQGPYDESVRYRDFMGWEMPWYSAQASLDALMDLTVYGRREPWEDSPPAGHNRGKSRAPGGQTGAPSPSGRAWRPDVPTTWAPPVAERIPALLVARGSWLIPIGRFSGLVISGIAGVRLCRRLGRVL